VRPDLSQPTHGLVKEDTLGGILFLRLKASHLRPKHRLFNRIHYKQYLLGNLKMRRNGSNASVGGGTCDAWIFFFSLLFAVGLLKFTGVSQGLYNLRTCPATRGAPSMMNHENRDPTGLRGLPRNSDSRTCSLLFRSTSRMTEALLTCSRGLLLLFGRTAARLAKALVARQRTRQC
jgi:hypothetical protein